MHYLSAGYYLILPTLRKEYMDKAIVPESVLSVNNVSVRTILIPKIRFHNYRNVLSRS